MTSPPDPSPAEVVAAVKDAERYERLQTLRRRGVVHVGWALVFLGWLFGFGTESGAWSMTLWKLFGLVVSMAGASLIIHARRRGWKGVFEEPTGRRSRWLTHDDWNFMTFLGVVGLASAIAISLFMLFVYSDMIQESVVVGLMVSVSASVFVIAGKQTRDRPLFLLGLAFLLASAPFWVVPLPDDVGMAAPGLLFALPLFVLGFYRLLAPRRWLVR